MPTALHQRKRLTRAKDRACHIGRQETRDLIIADLGKRERFENSGIVDEDIDTRMVLGNLGKRCPYAVRLADIAMDCEMWCADFVGDGLNFRKRAPEQDAGLTIGGKASCARGLAHRPRR
jgi:hypothetical protein